MAELDLAKQLMTVHLEAYYLANERERAVIARTIDDAWRMEGDVISERFPGREWKHAWPEGLRAALLALWSTPRRPSATG